MSRKKRRWILWAGTAALVLCGAAAYWVVSLFSQLDTIAAQRALRRPARYFSDIETLRPGQYLPAAGFVTRLRERGYKPAAGAELAEGSFRISGGGRVDVFLRPFIAPDGRASAGMYSFKFSGDILSRIEQFPSNKTLDELALEPLPLGDPVPSGPEGRPWLRLESFPKHLREAVLASEDKRFYAHPGIDLLGIARAAASNAFGRGAMQGGSTLTQQLVRNAFLTQDRTWRRKLTETLLALLMEARYGKDRIFEMYLNQIYLGQSGLHTVYGMEDASRSYFGKPAAALTLAESAMLTGMIPAPTRGNPRVSLVQALERRNRVLGALERDGRITAAEAARAKRELAIIIPLSARVTGGYYADWARQLMEQQYGSAALESEGYNIYTAMDPELEKDAEKALSSQPLEGAVVVIDQHTGFVRAMAGGSDFRKTPFNRAVLAKRSPGSAFKPVIYAAGLEYKIFTPESMLSDRPVKLLSGGKEWEPKNYDGTFMGDVSYRDALVFSRNIPAVEVLLRTGFDRVAELAAKMGITSGMRFVPSLALGTSEVTPLELTAAYAPLANGGYAVKPVFIRWVTDRNGRLVEENKPELRRVLTGKTAEQVTGMLEDAVNRGTGKNVRNLGYAGPAAGKTGTSDLFNDAWFVGYTPDLLCGVWLGHDEPASLGASAASIAVPVWTEFVKAAPPPAPKAKFGRRYPAGIKGFFMRLFGG